MPKTQFINPLELRKPTILKLGSIPVNAYEKTMKEELLRYSKDDMLRIYRDMFIIREFETMLNLIKTTEEYNGIPYSHPGPAHLSIGQEAAAVGMAYYLDMDDYIFGSHRSHGEILAKGLSAIQKLDENGLYEIMKTFFDGRILSIVEKGHKGDIKSLAIKFLTYGTLAEIFARETGFNKGLGGSMHAFFTPFGIYPNNAIVGGSGDIAVGAALFKKVNRKSGIVVANIGDASLGCGPVWEGMTFAAMDQYHELWEGDMKGGLPVIFNIMNNQYGMGGQTCGETMGYTVAARVGAAINRENMHAERVDGYNPLAVIDAYERKIQLLKEKKGPVLLDVLTYRFSGHSPSDSSSYRSKEEVEAWESVDSIESYSKELINSGVAEQSTLEKIQAETREMIKQSFTLSIDDQVSPRMNLVTHPELIGEMMFSNESVDRMEDSEPDVNLPYAENPRVKQIAKKERYAFDDKGKAYSAMKQYQFRDGIFE
ncbi:MAG: thiamine pyrophosphate-dependent dehydrogenase E1 component subunit alpha, partial [Bacteroidota bacterium]|nr:thiamine pyrophosphate-dependent dehydrogenase E1 component subunit alpha [Bacteroidota bacterium]